MSNQSSYSGYGSLSRPYYHPHVSMISTDTRKSYGFGREIDQFNPPQPVEIDLSSARTLPNPSAANIWDYAFQSSCSVATSGSRDISAYLSPHPQRQPQIESQGSIQDPLVNWYNNNDGPWTPIIKVGSNVESNNRQISQRTSNRAPNTYGPFGRKHLPSDAGSYPLGLLPSDSGYGSNVPKRSDGSASILSSDITDRDADFQSQVGLTTDYKQYQAIGEALQSHDNSTSDLWTTSKGTPSPVDTRPIIICPECQKVVKTKSELKKHDARHRKPHKCLYPGCTRTEGFSTTNDLDRHTKSKHSSAIQGAEPTKRYRCMVPGCKSTGKSWPRLDNFRSHLKKIHHPADKVEDELVRRGEYTESVSDNLDPAVTINNPQMASHLLSSSIIDVDTLPGAHLGSRWTHVSTDYPQTVETFQNPEGSESVIPPEQEEILVIDTPPCHTVQPEEVFHQSRITDQRTMISNILSAPVSPDESASKAVFATTQHTASLPKVHLQGKTTRHNVSASDAKLTEAIKTALVRASHRSPDEPQRDRSPESCLPSGDSPTTPRNPDPSAITSGGKGYPANLSPSKVDSDAEAMAKEVLNTLHRLGYIIYMDPNHSSKPQNPGSLASSKSDNLVICMNCGNFRGRPCELKKHMKRHTKPYGCTFLMCNKSFGSKNDWKRHENSQHFQLESWRCYEEKFEGATCAKVYYREQTFKDHLKKDHNISDSEVVKSKVDGCRIGRNCQARFWCGFCNKLINLAKKGIDAWTERFDHIDDHFMGRNGAPVQTIQDWISVDSDKPRGEVATPHSLNPSSGKDDPEESSSSSGKSPNDPDAVGGSPSNAIILEDQVNGSNKRKHPSSSAGPAPQPSKKPRSQSKRNTFIYCCNCNMPQNPRLSERCMQCDSQHEFCVECKYERAREATEDSAPNSWP